MNAAEQGDPWTGQQLAARLAGGQDAVPEPDRFVVFRATLHADGRSQAGFELPDPPYALAEHEWPQWLQAQGLVGGGQLRVAVLVVRETLDPAGRIADCVLERRRGAADGPLRGHPARVEFIGPARLLRLYRLDRNFRLQEFAPSPRLLPPRPTGAGLFAGERLAVERRFGPAAQLIDSREPTLFEEMAGLSTVAHLRLAGGEEVACGIGWHGVLPYTLVADFPRLALPARLSPLDEAVVQQALRRHRLIRYETRLDEDGIAVMARQQGTAELMQLRCANGQVAVERYQSASRERPNEDQRRWLRFVQEHEQLTELDHYRDGGSDSLVVLTGDPGGQVQQHLVDADGVEIWRRPADDTAAAALHRERVSQDGASGPDSPTPLGRAMRPPGHATPGDNVLTLASLVDDAIAAAAAARTATEGLDAMAGVTGHLRAFLQTCEALAAEHTASRLAVLLAEIEDDAPDPRLLLPELIRLESDLLEELALLRPLLLQPAQWRRLNQPAPFGAEVEARFPSSAHDIQEAIACLALRHPTAAMFHCMRVVQRGILAVARHAGAEEPTGSWAAILSQLGAACPPQLSGALFALRRLRRHWRAPGLLPADKYTEAEAAAVLRGLEAFLRELAGQCGEDGRAIGD